MPVAFFLLEGSRGPARSNAGRGSRFANDQTPRNVGNATYVYALDGSAERKEEMGLAFAAVTFAVVTGFSVFASAIQLGR